MINVQPEENCRIDEKKKVQIWVEIGPKWVNNDWFEFRLTGTNPERLVRMIGPNSERLVRIPNEFDVGVFKNPKETVESVELLCCSDLEVLVCKAI